MDQRIRSALASRGYVLFTAGGDWLAAPVEEVAGMIDADRLAPLPGPSSSMAGVLAFRGSVVPTLDLAAALGIDESTAAPRYAVVRERGTDRFALLVRGMPRLVPAREVVEREVPRPPAPASEEGEPDAGTPEEIPAVLGLYEIAGREVKYLDYWSLMDTVAPPAAFRLTGLGSR